MEKPITDKIISYLNSVPGCSAWKRFNSGMSSTTNFPDVTGVINVKGVGIRIEIEVKQPGEVPRMGQYSKMREFRKLGCISFWTDSLESAEKQFARWVRFCTTHDTKLSYNDLISRNRFIVKDLKKE